MSRSRTLSWSAALRHIKGDRIHLTPGQRQAIQRNRGFADIAARRASAPDRFSALLKGDSFDRRGIMRLAIESARARREVTKESWPVCLSAALTGTWRAAKAVRAAAAIRRQVALVHIAQLSSAPSRPAVRGGDVEPLLVAKRLFSPGRTGVGAGLEPPCSALPAQGEAYPRPPRPSPARQC